MIPYEDPKLERLIHRTLRDLPERRAPRTLEMRVLAAIAARQALPWWRQSFAHWPLVARGGFVLAAIGVAWAFTRVGGGSTALAADLQQPLGLLSGLRSAWSSVGEAGSTLLRCIPTVWLYGAVVGVAVVYTALFSLGATAYRTLVQNR